MLSRDQLQRAATGAGYQVESYEKAYMLLRLLDAIRAHPFLGTRLALKGGPRSISSSSSSRGSPSTST